MAAVRVAGVPPAPPAPPKDDAMERKALFLEFARKFIKRDGIESLLKWLEDSDFFTAPASTQYHGSFRGGLCAHSLQVMHRMLQLAPLFFPDIDDADQESLTIVSLFHDVCKVDFYVVSTRNVKDEHGNWKTVPYYAIEEKYPYGHGEKSVDIIRDHMNLTRDERLAINWHMNLSDGRAAGTNGGTKTIFQAKRECPLIIVLSMADEAAAFIDGV